MVSFRSLSGEDVDLYEVKYESRLIATCCVCGCTHETSARSLREHKIQADQYCCQSCRTKKQHAKKTPQERRQHMEPARQSQGLSPDLKLEDVRVCPICNEAYHPVTHTYKNKAYLRLHRTCGNAKCIQARKSHPEYWTMPQREKMGIRMKGEGNPHYGKPASHSRPIFAKVGCRIIKFRSSWEVWYAGYVLQRDYPDQWEYESISFPLNDGRSYIPDFRLPDGSLVEVKGYWRGDAKEKFELFRMIYPTLDVKLITYDFFKNLKMSKSDIVKQAGVFYV